MCSLVSGFDVCMFAYSMSSEDKARVIVVRFNANLRIFRKCSFLHLKLTLSLFDAPGRADA